MEEQIGSTNSRFENCIEIFDCLLTERGSKNLKSCDSIDFVLVLYYTKCYRVQNIISLRKREKYDQRSVPKTIHEIILYVLYEGIIWHSDWEKMFIQFV